MTGKQKCKILKEIRRQIAAQNDIRYVIEECRHQGNCRGTCPKCEWEVRMLEKELEKRRASGKKVVLAGISAGFLLTACAPIDAIKELISPVVHPLEGDVMAESTDSFNGADIPGEIVADETEVLEATEGEPVIEGLLEVPETELEEEEVEPDEIVEFAGAPIMEAENCETVVESEEEYLIAGGIMPADFDEEETVLEGDLIYPQEEEVQP